MASCPSITTPSPFLLCVCVCIYKCDGCKVSLAEAPSVSCSITPLEMAPFTQQLLSNLFKALSLPASAENEYIMKGTGTRQIND